MRYSDSEPNRRASAVLGDYAVYVTEHSDSTGIDKQEALQQLKADMLGIVGEDEDADMKPLQSIEMSMMYDARNQLREELRKSMEGYFSHG